MHSTIHAPAAYRRAARPAGLLSRVLDAWDTLRQRAALARLDDRLLDDVGLSRDAARAEAARPVWDVPATWRN